MDSRGRCLLVSIPRAARSAMRQTAFASPRTRVAWTPAEVSPSKAPERNYHSPPRSHACRESAVRMAPCAGLTHGGREKSVVPAEKCAHGLLRRFETRLPASAAVWLTAPILVRRQALDPSPALPRPHSCSAITGRWSCRRHDSWLRQRVRRRFSACRSRRPAVTPCLEQEQWKGGYFRV